MLENSNLLYPATQMLVVTLATLPDVIVFLIATHVISYIVEHQIKRKISYKNKITALALIYPTGSILLTINSDMNLSVIDALIRSVIFLIECASFYALRKYIKKPT